MGLGLRFVNDLITFSCDGNDSIIGLIGCNLFVLITSLNQPVIDDTVVLEVVVLGLLLEEEDDDDDDMNRLFSEHEDDNDCDNDKDDNDVAY